MKTIDNGLLINGMRYDLLKRSKNVCLFSIDGGRYYEVSRISILPAEDVFGHYYPEREALCKFQFNYIPPFQLRSTTLNKSI